MNAPRQIRIDRFPKGSWQVIWYGDLAYDASDGLYSQPTIALVLQSLEGREKRPRITVPMSLIAVVPLGSIWEDGVRVIERPAEEMLSRKIEVFPSRVEETTAGGPLDDRPGSPHLLPFRPFNLHRDDTTSPCLRWTSTSGEVFVLPATEALRFYFGTSSFLLKTVVTGRPPLDSLWEQKTLDVETGIAHVQLAANIPKRKSPFEIARIAFDPIARRAAERVNRSLRIAAGSRRTVQPHMLFPFTGRATLRVAGTPIIVEGEPQRFVILRIDSCTGPYPFNELNMSGGKDIKDAYEGDDNDVVRPARDASHDLSVGPGEPTSERIAWSEAQWDSHRFVDLVRKTVRFGDEVRTSMPSSGGGGSLASDDIFGMGDGNPGGTGAPLEIGIDSPPRTFAFIDHRLLGDEHPAELWGRLAQELMQGSLPIQAILIGAVRPDWADEMSSECYLSLVDDDSRHTRPASAWHLALEGWIRSHGDNRSRWHAFSRSPPPSDLPSSWTCVEGLHELSAAIHRAFEKRPDHQRGAPNSPD